MEFFRTLGLALAVGVMLTGCGSESIPSSAATPTLRPVGVVTQTTTDCSLSLTAGSIKAGRIAFTFINRSGYRAGLDVWRMPDSDSYAKLLAGAQEDRRLAEAGQPPQGDHAYLGSSPSIRAEWDLATSRTVAGSLEPGMYALVCIGTFPKVSEPRLLAVVGPVVVEPA